MALKSTIYKAEVDIADIDRDYYQSHSLTIARHPSETEERLMLRLLAFILNAGSDLAFGRGVSADDEPDLWRRNLQGDIELWIEVGLPAERRLQKAAKRARQVRVYAYGERTASVWWEKSRVTIQRLTNVEVLRVAPAGVEALTAMAGRNVRLQCTIQDGEIWLDNRQIDVTTF